MPGTHVPNTDAQTCAQQLGNPSTDTQVWPCSVSVPLENNAMGTVAVMSSTVGFSDLRTFTPESFDAVDRYSENEVVENRGSMQVALFNRRLNTIRKSANLHL